MVINLGMKLEIDPKLTGTKNLFLQLYGRAPQQDCSGEARQLISKLVQQVKYSERMLDYFSLNDNKPTIRDWNDNFLTEIIHGLNELRERFNIEILALFNSLPQEINTTVALAGALVTSKINAQKLATDADELRRQMRLAEASTSGIQNTGAQSAGPQGTELQSAGPQAEIQETANPISAQEPPSTAHGTTLSETKRQELYATPTDFAFSAAISKALNKSIFEIKTIGDLVKLTPKELFNIPHIGDGAIIEILNYLLENGLSLTAPKEED